MASFRRSRRKANVGEQVEVRSPRDSACAGDLIKSSEEGERDWKTLGNIMTATVLGEVLCASYADYKYGRRSKDFRPDIEWKFSYEENDVLVFAKQHHTEQEVISFMGRSVIDLPVSSIASVLQNLENFYQWNKFMTESRLVHVLSESDDHRDVIGYFLHESKRCLVRTKRDMVLFLHSTYQPERFVQAAISVDHPSCPLVKNVTRAECCLGSGWVVEMYEGRRSKSLVSYICNVDMKGLIPQVILNRYMQRQPMAVHYMRECAVEMARSQRPLNSHARFSCRVSKILTDSDSSPDKVALDSGNRTSAEEKEDSTDMTSIEFAGNAMGSHLVGSLSLQYEDPVGISEFIGYHTTPRRKKQHRHRHQCYQEQTGAADTIFSSGSCEECRLRTDPNYAVKGAGKCNKYMTR